MRCGSDGSALRLAARLAKPSTVSLLSAALLLGTPGLVTAQPDPDGIAALIADVAEANQQLQNLGAQIAEEKESVNKALVELQTAREDADAAQHEVEAGRQAIADADAAIVAAQKRFNTFAASTYVNGPSDSYLTAADPSEMIATAAAGQTLALSSQQAVDTLKRARIEQLNKESAARAAKQKADQAVADAQSSQDAAVAALTDTQRRFGEQQGEIDRLAARRNEAQAKLAAARRQDQSQEGPAPAGAPTGDRWGNAVDPANPAAAKQAEQWDGPWDPTLPMIPSANIPGDPIAVINQVLGISQTSAQVTANMGRKFLESIGLASPESSGINNGQIPRVYGRQASEYVIRRGLSQRGVPYSWGGGTAAGPSRGIGSGAGTVGFDCSGLILYSFAGVGIKLPHYSGSQYKMGRQIPSALARRGDVIFYGPGGSQHVTLYLGNGLMLEAPDVGQPVKVSPVRKSGMTPFVVRYIEY
ncbi:NlpC/P60 family peptidoglycan endopeptidase RipA [Mycolicibacter longobardus]|uniref:NlpC/P60 family peptidoglycan endopeptidase RipA n=1 Tax=Mycolicibacter longobardus TaxID=1108812 RepID=UPI0039088FB5